MSEKVGVIIANTGTPSEPTKRSVKKYLSQFLMDPRICPMPRPIWWCLLHAVILRKRAAASAEKYRAIWTPQGSPLTVTYEALERGLNAYYAERGRSVAVRAAMSYGKPSFKQAVKSLKEEGCTSLVVLPMYPQSAFSTTGSVRDGIAKAVRRARWKHPVTVIDDYGTDPVYVGTIAASVRNAGFSEERGDRLLFSYHSIPLKDIEAGDTYELQTGATSLAVAGELGLDRRSWTISYQSRFDTSRTWLSPFTRPTLVRLGRAAEGEGRLFFICPNFAVDCLETLYDIPFELEPIYRAALAGQYVDADEEPGAVENMGRAPKTRERGNASGKGNATGRSGAHGRTEGRGGENPANATRAADALHTSADAAQTESAENASGDFRRGMHRHTDGDDAFIYVPCLNKSRAHLKVLTHVLAPYVGDED